MELLARVLPSHAVKDTLLGADEELAGGIFPGVAEHLGGGKGGVRQGDDFR